MSARRIILKLNECISFFVLITKAEFDSALADFNARLTTFEAGINSKIDSQVTSYLDRNGIWNGKQQTFNTPYFRYFINHPDITPPDETTVLSHLWALRLTYYNTMLGKHKILTPNKTGLLYLKLCFGQTVCFIGSLGAKSAATNGCGAVLRLGFSDKEYAWHENINLAAVPTEDSARLIKTCWDEQNLCAQTYMITWALDGNLTSTAVDYPQVRTKLWNGSSSACQGPGGSETIKPYRKIYLNCGDQDFFMFVQKDHPVWFYIGAQSYNGNVTGPNASYPTYGQFDLSFFPCMTVGSKTVDINSRDSLANNSFCPRSAIIY